MSVRVHLPPVLRSIMGGERWLSAEGSSIGAALTDLGERHPALALHFFDEQGVIRRNLVFVHDGVLVRSREASVYELRPGDEIILANALAGG